MFRAGSVSSRIVKRLPRAGVGLDVLSSPLFFSCLIAWLNNSLALFSSFDVISPGYSASANLRCIICFTPSGPFRS